MAFAILFALSISSANSTLPSRLRMIPRNFSSHSTSAEAAEIKPWRCFSGISFSNTCIDAPHGVVVGRTYQGIKLFKKEMREINVQEYDFVIGEIVIEGMGKIVAEFVSADDVVYGEGVLYADYNKISTDAVWRARRIGDVFAKFGTGSKKLNDYFTDKKIENLLRDKVPVLASGSQVFVVAGQDISENVKIDGETEQIVAIRFINN